MMLETLSACPLCQSTSIAPFLSVKDYTVSQQEFNLVTCMSCSFTFTNPRPAADAIQQFYKSEKYISHSGGSTRLIDRLYRIARNYTLKWKLQMINQYAQEKTILDYGCGTGNFLSYLKHNGWDTIGVEPAEDARRKANENGIVAHSNLTDINQVFSIITLWHVLEHVHTLTTTLSEIKKRLNVSGTIFIAVPNYKSADAQHYQEHWAAFDAPRHLWHFNQKTMTRLLTNCGFKIKKILPMKLDAYYVSLLSEQYKNQHENFISHYLKAGVQAWQSNKAASKTGEYSSLIYVATHQ
jgi:2-polyprenyl-3-methyl-5-hydroxy-6-metoxy-1,4-benzoquinol methylase